MNILLVEDSPEVSLITVEYLIELGHQAVAVVDAERALERIAADVFDVVMTDVSLPGMSGVDLAKELIKRHPGVPVVIASGYGTFNVDALVGPKQTQIFSLQKPYDMATLEKTLDQAVGSTASSDSAG